MRFRVGDNSCVRRIEVSEKTSEHLIRSDDNISMCSKNYPNPGKLQGPSYS